MRTTYDSLGRPELFYRLPHDDGSLRVDRRQDLVELLHGDLLRGLHGFFSPHVLPISQVGWLCRADSKTCSNGTHFNKLFEGLEVVKKKPQEPPI